MKIGIVSDSHGYTDALDAMLAHEEAQDVEAWFFAGDIAPDAEYLEMVTDVPIYKVDGNNDWPRPVLPGVVIEDIAGHRIFLTHGHMFGVSFARGVLKQAAKEEGADIAIYGHTHVADIDDEDEDILVLNPGSVARPRDEERGSFMVMDLQKGKKPSVKLIRL